jgi:hypothetical protein
MKSSLPVLLALAFFDSLEDLSMRLSICVIHLLTRFTKCLNLTDVIFKGWFKMAAKKKKPTKVVKAKAKKPAAKPATVKAGKPAAPKVAAKAKKAVAAPVAAKAKKAVAPAPAAPAAKKMAPLPKKAAAVKPVEEKPAKAAKAAPAKPAPKEAKPATKATIKAAKEEVVEIPPEEVVLTDSEGRRFCRVKDCDQVGSVDGYCRLHYLVYWKRIQVRKKILSEGKLERYIEELTARYPDKYLDMLRKDLRSEKEFLAAIQELEIDESAVESEFAEDEAQNYLDEVRGMSETTPVREEEEF